MLGYCPLSGRGEIYNLVERTLGRQQYLGLPKKDKGVVRHYLSKLSGRSLPQITRLIRQYRQSGVVRPRQPRRRRFPTRYTPGDIALLAAADAAHEGLSGPAVRRILWREYCVYHKEAYQRLASISSSHIYNLRRGAAYRQHHVHHTKTRARAVSIGERRKPDHRGRPGSFSPPCRQRASFGKVARVPIFPLRGAVRQPAADRCPA